MGKLSLFGPSYLLSVLNFCILHIDAAASEQFFGYELISALTMKELEKFIFQDFE